MKTTLILLLTFFSISSFASERAIQNLFKKFYNSNQVQDRVCRENVEKFAKHLNSKDLLDSNFKLVIIEAPGHPWTFGHLPAFKSRFGKYVDGMYHQNWGYHAIGIYNGKVYDFSFDQSPRILSIRRYMDEMYLPLKPFLINGKTFRTRGMGPYFTKEYAKEEREDFHYRIFSFNNRAKSSQESSTLNYKEFLRYIK